MRNFPPVLNKSKQYLPLLLKILVFAGCTAVLVFKFQDSEYNWYRIFEELASLPWFILPLLMCVSLASWLVESKKWQFLVGDFYGLRFRESVLQNLTAQAASFITPLRSGEFVAKALYFPKSLRKQVTQRVFIGNFSQMAVTVAVGIIGLFVYEQELMDDTWKYVGLIILTGLLIFLAYSWVRKKLGLNAVRSDLWFKTVGFSTLRYLIFSSNWLLVLGVLYYDQSIVTILSCITVWYLLISTIPLIQILDLPVRILAVVTIFPGDTEIVLLATTLIWITNTVFPTVLGCALLPFKSRIELETA
ncbi:hypothetical protein BST97_09575 [Nonlabens spongiae]|uniref:Lysylphosphatidylglycerol synthetase n=1 Tax=Nonlabens spongiae TaxID=331648 RepID=A0A1W6MKU6_9FLAO|nr:hypothetical protein BST97_09575 [Nonlabens spongiae]